MTPFETYKHAGLTVELHYDDDSSIFNPRKENDNAGVIVSFTREIDGDEYLSVDENLTTDCPSCGGSGENQGRYQLLRRKAYGWIIVGAGSFESMESELIRAIGKLGYDAFGIDAVKLDCAPCLRCDGIGMINTTVATYLHEINNAEVVLPLRFEDYGSSGSRISERDGEDDQANMAIYCTAETLQKEWDGDREKALKCLKSEVNEYGSWLSGEVYGYVIKDTDGEDLPDKFMDSCWGFIGDNTYVREEANSAAEHVAERLAKESVESTEMAARDIVTVD